MNCSQNICAILHNLVYCFCDIFISTIALTLAQQFGDFKSMEKPFSLCLRILIRIFSYHPWKTKLKKYVLNWASSKLTLYQAFFWTFRKKLKPKKTQNSRKILKNSSKTPKKLKNRQLQSSWVVAKLNENSIFRGKA